MIKRIIIPIAAILIIGVAVLLAFVEGDQLPNLKGGFSQGGNFYIESAGAGSAIDAGDVNATTTKAYLVTTATASTTVVGSLGRADRLVLNVQSMGSTSAATLNFTIDVSNDKIDWFVFDQATSTSNSPTLHQAIQPVHTWTVATTSESGVHARRSFTFKDLAGKYFRIRFGTTGANQAIWVNAIPLENTPN